MGVLANTPPMDSERCIGVSSSKDSVALQLHSNPKRRSSSFKNTQNMYCLLLNPGVVWFLARIEDTSFLRIYMFSVQEHQWQGFLIEVYWKTPPGGSMTSTMFDANKDAIQCMPVNCVASAGWAPPQSFINWVSCKRLGNCTNYKIARQLKMLKRHHPCGAHV